MIGFVGGGTNPRYNAEGYLDLTAYNAIYGGKEMIEWKAGDIVSLYMMDGRESYRVVLKPYNRYATTMILYEDERYENEYEVVAMTKMHADLGKIGFTSGRDLEAATLVRSMKDSEFEELMVRVAESIGVPMSYFQQDGEGKAAPDDNGSDVDREELTKAYEKIGKLEKEKEELKEKIREHETNRSKVGGVIRDTREELAKAVCERDVYKELYADMLNRFVSASVRPVTEVAS